MHRSLILAGIILIPSFFVATNVFAQKEQVVVIGVGLGIHSFSETDEVRRDFFITDADAGGMFQLYGEWYLFERLGLGIRIQAIGLSETLLAPGIDFTTDVTVTSQFLTLQFIPFIADDGYVRIGLWGVSARQPTYLPKPVPLETIALHLAMTPAHRR